MRNLDRFLDEAASFVCVKKTEVIFNLVITVVCSGLTLLMAAWLILQIRMMWGI